MNSKIDLFQNLIKHIGQLAFFLLIISFGSQAQYFNLGAMWQGPKLVFSVSPSATANAGSPFVISPSISVTNLKGITINSSSALITLSAFSDDRCSVAAPGVLSATALSESAASGTARFSGVSYSADGTIYLKGKAPGIRPACSSAIVVSSGVSATALKQIRNNPIGSSPYSFYASGNRLFFSATSPGDISSVPWVSDGSAGGTQTLSSLLTFPSDPVYLTSYGGFDYFIVDYKLWRTDWTQGGTINLNVSAPNSYGGGETFITHTGKLAWLSSGDYPDYYLNSTDGSLAGTTSSLLPTSIGSYPYLFGSTASGVTIGGGDAQGPNVNVCDLEANCNVLVSNIGNSASSFRNVFVSGAKTFFTIHYSGSGSRYWVTDGTVPGTFVLETSWMMDGSMDYIGKIGANDLFIGQPTAAGGGTYRIYASDGTSGANKWVILGDTGLYLFTASYDLDFSAPAGIGYAVRFRNRTDAADSVGNVLWFTDGTIGGTQLIGPSFVSNDRFTYSPITPISYGGKVYYPSYSATNGHEMWVFDGALAPALLADKEPGTGDLFSPQSSYVWKTTPASLPLGFVFTALSATNGQQLWISDGTAGGTQVVPGVTPKLNGEKTFTILGGKAYFSASDITNGEELWVSDGTLAGTHALKYINPEIGDADIDSMTKLGSKLFFTATDGVQGHELWVTDGTTVGTTIVKRLGVGNVGSNPNQLTLYNGKLFFSATPTSDYNENYLFESDGTSAGTLAVAAIPLNAYGDGLLDNLTAASDGLYFIGTTAANGMELWKSDGTTAGTNFIDVTAGASSTFDWYADMFTTVGSKIFFDKNRDYNNYFPWVSDGTLGGTTQLSTVEAGNGGIYPRDGVSAGTNVFFEGWEGTNGSELWITDGTPGGTNLVTNLNILGSSNPNLHVAIGNKILFTADDGFSGNELWISDGTSGGTLMLADITVGVTGSDFRNFIMDGGNAYFFAYNASGWGLWTTDGTIMGTMLITQVSTSFDNQPYSLMAYNGNLYFTNWDAAHGWEMWKSDKTAVGTTLHRDLYAGTASSYPYQMTEMGGKIYCSARVGMGSQLFKVDP